ncbi:MAG: hypothetical protein IJJ30_05980 [Erysipelotrichaceae bacterium]|nr:hypothetical protein [Erysipelotrichaceae bacterium]
MKSIFITIDHLPDCVRTQVAQVGQELTLKKDTGNAFDDEAIRVFNKNNSAIGYVANSVETVARGTYSAGRVYDKIEDGQKCVVRFMIEDYLIAEIACAEAENALE